MVSCREDQHLVTMAVKYFQLVAGFRGVVPCLHCRLKVPLLPQSHLQAQILDCRMVHVSALAKHPGHATP